MLPKVTAIGSATRDFFLIPENQYIKLTPKENSTHGEEYMCIEHGAKLGAEYLKSHIGGTAVNVAIGLKRLGIPAAIRSTIGEDGAGRSIITKLEKEGVATDLITIAHSHSTDRALIIIHPETRDRTIFIKTESRKGIKIDYELIDSECIYISSIKRNWENIYKKIVSLVKRKKKRLFLTPGTKQIEAGIEKIKHILNLTEVVFLNKDEAFDLTKIEKKSLTNNEKANLKKVAKTIASYGPKIVVITDGEKGAYIYKKKSKMLSHLKALKPKLVDVTGAGDAFASAFLASYLKGLSLKKCGQNGIKNSTAVIGRMGTVRGLLREEDLDFSH